MRLRQLARWLSQNILVVIERGVHAVEKRILEGKGFLISSNGTHTSKILVPLLWSNVFFQRLNLPFDFGVEPSRSACISPVASSVNG